MSQSNIFVIDDDASVRKAVHRLLRAAGMAVRTFAGAEEFLAAGLPLPDCLVVDVRMPGMSGLELQRHLAAENHAVPIVFITAHHDEVACQNALLEGAVAILHKPFEDHVLLQALSKAIAQTHGRQAEAAPVPE